ncbi:transcriptional regulator [Stenotrophomonas maltophilia]|uniref:helix-turn-helix domain-containing protein n=1 Tax=Stenotrophomonas maltophilia TaxID=40324 RepID=UPI000810E5F1|nr:helix-turn-helix transcriptional regulator [Stenotrophomonas maltophilia]OCK49016.1 transcriptional regulator [Stenotrophomonas maltophilia]
MPSSIYANRLRQARLAAGLSQIRLGELIGLDPSVGSPRISRYEKGHHTPDIESAKQIADTLAVPLPFFFAEDDRMARLILMYAKLDDASKDRLLRRLRRLLGPTLID